jgi:DNA-binding PadR family transcriptional regulator
MSVRNAILGLLSQSPRHGYMLRAAFEALVGGKEIWDVKPAQIYTTLARLEESGLVRQETREETRQDGADPAAGPEKRVYAITEEGKKELASWFAEGVQEERQRDEFFVKLMLSLDAEGADPGKVIQAQRGTLYQELHDLTARRNAADPHRELSTIILLDKTLMHVEADLRWLDMVEARLGEMGRQKTPPPAARPRGRPRKVT